jgi:methyl-accepting chemotaxis protein
MFPAFRKQPPAATADAAAHADDGGMDRIVTAIGAHAASLGRDAAEVRGIIEDTNHGAAEHAAAIAALAAQVGEVTGAQQAIGERTQASLQAVTRARAAVATVGGEVGVIVETLRQVADAAGEITQIAMQTRLVAFNASVEAKRAGDTGHGFSLVADAVRDLASKVEASSHQITAQIANLDSRVDALSRELALQGEGARQSAFHQALGNVEASVARIDTASGSSHAICGDLNQLMHRIGEAMQSTEQSLSGAMSHSEAFLTVSEQLIESVAASGVRTENTPYLDAVQEAAAQIGRLLEDAVRTETISMQALFDTDYRPIPGTQPAQHLTGFVELADRLFPQVQDRLLSLSDKVVYCVASDRNGYVPTHNRKYCHPQRGDLAWDTANSRYRRLFADRTALASARSRRPFLLQTYRRDMGGGRHVVMKEAAAPITVNGKHWGAVRLAFQF